MRYIFLSVILMMGLGLVTIFYVNQTKLPLKTSLTPFYQLLGQPIRTANKAMGRVLPVNEVDEKKYGEIISMRRYANWSDTTSSEYQYVNGLFANLVKTYAKKDFNYRVFVLNDYSPNAFALPGGVVLVTKGLLSTMQSESELVSVLAHELGHVERGHCFDAVKYELLARKIKSEKLGELADFATFLLLKHSYSKNQENDADNYAYDLLLESKYTPAASGEAFKSLKNSLDSFYSDDKANLFRDYFSSHPPLELRIAKFEAQAQNWREQQSEFKRYIGKQNLEDRISFFQEAFDNEWDSLVVESPSEW